MCSCVLTQKYFNLPSCEKYSLYSIIVIDYFDVNEISTTVKYTLSGQFIELLLLSYCHFNIREMFFLYNILSAFVTKCYQLLSDRVERLQIVLHLLKYWFLNDPFNCKLGQIDEQLNG